MNSDLSFLLRCDSIEGDARMRVLTTVAALYCGWRSSAKVACDVAVDDPTQAWRALVEVNALPARLRRQVLSAFGEIVWPSPTRGKERQQIDQATATGACPRCGL